MKAWYALHTKPNAEIRVARALHAREVAVFLPLLPGTGGGAGRPLFPTYLFIECDLARCGPEHLQWIPGLRRVLHFDGRPAVVPESAIKLIHEELAKIEAAGGWPGHSFRPGDEVVIDTGPLAGMRGIFQGPVGPAQRVHILLRFLGHVNRTEVPVQVLRRAPEEGEARSKRRSTRGRGRHIIYRGDA